MIILLIYLIPFAYAGLVCNGDFEAYHLNESSYGDYYLETASNLTCWYNLNYGIIEIKRLALPVSSQAAELTTTLPYTLCQDVTLVLGNKYRLNYSLLCPKKLYNMLMTVKLNSVILSTLYISSASTFGQNSVEFDALSELNQFCFSETHSANFFYNLKNFVGGLLDNITIEDITPQVIN